MKTLVKNEDVLIRAMDEPAYGGAYHVYEIGSGPDPSWGTRLCFQKGPVKEKGYNGIQNEDLLYIVIDRLKSFQQDIYCCRENAIAITKLEEALMWLDKRTERRKALGIEGTSKVDTMCGQAQTRADEEKLVSGEFEGPADGKIEPVDVIRDLPEQETETHKNPDA
jgi:hypothetical protein